MQTICIKCGEETNLSVTLCDGETITCPDCNAEYSIDDVRDLIVSWGPVLAWLDTHPARQPQPATCQSH